MNQLLSVSKVQKLVSKAAGHYVKPVDDAPTISVLSISEKTIGVLLVKFSWGWVSCRVDTDKLEENVEKFVSSCTGRKVILEEVDI